MDLKSAPVIFIDADDTLWENEGYFREAEDKFARLLKPYTDVEGVRKMLWNKQEDNIPYFGYGSKTYFIAMVDAATDLCSGKLPRNVFNGIRRLIIELSTHPVELIEGVERTLAELSTRHRLILATKGDSPEQMRKVRESGLQKYFFCSEIMCNKTETDYLDMALKTGVAPQDMIMIGNSSRSDVLPVVNIGGTAFFVPHDIVWDHEAVQLPFSENIYEIDRFEDLLEYL